MWWCPCTIDVDETAAPTVAVESSSQELTEESLQRHRDSVSTLGLGSSGVSGVSHASRVMEMQSSVQEEATPITTAVTMDTTATTTTTVSAPTVTVETKVFASKSVEVMEGLIRHL